MIVTVAQKSLRIRILPSLKRDYRTDRLFDHRFGGEGYVLFASMDVRTNPMIYTESATRGFELPESGR